MAQDIFITEVETKSQGVIIHLNNPTSLKNGNIKSKEFFVSWDKIGQNLFKDYNQSGETPVRTPKTPNQ